MDFPYHWKYHLLKERTGTASGEPLDSLQCINFKQIEIVFMCNSIIIILTTINHESLAIWRNSCIWLHHTFVKHVSPYEFLTLNFVLPTVCFQMCPQIACLRRSIVALVAFVWFFSFIVSVSQGNIYNIDPTFTKIITFKILIHHHQLGIVVPCALSVSYWENEDCRYSS